MKRLALIPLTALVLGLGASAQAQQPAEDQAAAAASSVAVHHLGVGTVERFDAERRIVTIANQAIPGLDMPAMTMPFRVSESLASTPLSIGQPVAFLLASTADGLLITSVQPIAAPAKGGNGDEAASPDMHGSKELHGSHMSRMKMMAECREMMSKK